MGDSPDKVPLSPDHDENVEDDDITTNAVATGKLNVGKLLSANKTINEECRTALDTVGIICDITDMSAENKHGKPNPIDIVGSCC